METDLAVDNLALLAAFPPTFAPAVPFLDLDLFSLMGEAGVAKEAGEAVADGVPFALSLSAGFFLLGFFALGVGIAAASLDASADAASLSVGADGFLFGFLGFVSIPSVFGLVDFFAFEAAGFGVDPSAVRGEEAAVELGSSVSILMTAAA